MRTAVGEAGDLADEESEEDEEYDMDHEGK